MWEHAAYVWRAAFIIHAGSQFECAGEVGLFWKRMASSDLEQGSELSIFFLLWICSVCIIQLEHDGLEYGLKTDT